jgi:hypothetical protein
MAFILLRRSGVDALVDASKAFINKFDTHANKKAIIDYNKTGQGAFCGTSRKADREAIAPTSLFLSNTLHGPPTHVLAHTPTPHAAHADTDPTTAERLGHHPLLHHGSQERRHAEPCTEWCLGHDGRHNRNFRGEAFAHPIPHPPPLSPHGGICASFIDWPRATPCDALPLFVGCHE